MLPPFESRGAGPAVVFAHGSEMDRTMFAPQLAHLAARGRRAISVDQRARTAAGREPYSLYDLAADLRELLDELEIERCLLVGMSMGGFVALRAATMFPARLAGIAIIGGAMHRSYAQAERRRWLEDYEPLRGLERVPEEFAAGQAAVCFGPRARRQDPELVAAWVERWRAHDGESVYQEARSWITQDDITEALRGLALPALIVQGEEDAALPLADALSTFALLRGATMARLPGVGHTANLEAPAAVNRLLARFAEDLVATDPAYG